MSNIKISALGSASALDGTEEVPVVQSATTVKTTTQDIANLGGASYLVYTALLSQAATNNPVVEKVFQNTIGAIVWTRVQAGQYQGTLIDAFGDGTVCPPFTNPNDNAALIKMNYSTIGWYQILGGAESASVVTINTLDDTFNLKEWSDIGGRIFVEIRKY